MADDEKDGRTFHVNHAFASYGKDDTGVQHYFTEGNAHLIPDVLSDDEIDYRVEKGYITIDEPIEVDTTFGFVRPDEDIPPLTGTRPQAPLRSLTVSQVPDGVILEDAEAETAPRARKARRRKAED